MKKLLVSFSAGESSARMCDWLIKNKQDEYELHFVFMNTSKEREETLIFADKVDKYFNLNLTWIEATFDEFRGIGYNVTNFKDAKRNGEVFEDMIKCYGIPNNAFPHCNRELKLQPVTRWAKDVLGKGYYTAIGIRSDEVDRVDSNWRKKRYYYPLVNANITKPHVNLFWRDKPFRLELKGYQGNCNKCWKKSTRKLLTLEQEDNDTWWQDMEDKYGDYVPPHRDRADNNGKITFYRKNLSGLDLKKMSEADFKKATDDSVMYDIQEQLFGYDLDTTDGCIESCEIF